MSGEAELWLDYAEENLRVAMLAFDARLLNSCIQNTQQTVEKALKALRLARGLGLKKTHSIRELRDDLAQAGLRVPLTDDDCDLLDSVYLPSKYPLGSALPRFDPDESTTRLCLDIAERTVDEARRALAGP